MLWPGYCSHGIPTVNVKINGEWTQVKVRKLLYDDVKQPPSGKMFYLTTCGNKTCVNPNHVKVVSRSENCSIANANILPSKRRVAAKKFIEKNSKINQEIADQMRMSGKTAKELSQEYGISTRTIYDVLNHVTWTRNNIFTGLFR